MRFSLIIATLDERPNEFRRLLKSLKEQTFSDFEIIVISQGNYELTESILQEFPLLYTHIYSNKKGLSIARNLGLKQVKGDYITISDDDCWYSSDALENVSHKLKNNKNSVVCFNIYDPISNVYYKEYSSNQCNLNIFSICNVSSIELFFHRDIIKQGIKFDERFGVGAIYRTGEENLFLKKILEHNFVIEYFPIVIVYHKRPANRKIKMDLQSMIGKYYLFIEMYSILGFFLYYIFYIKHYKIVESKIKSLFPFLL